MNNELDTPEARESLLMNDDEINNGKHSNYSVLKRGRGRPRKNQVVIDDKKKKNNKKENKNISKDLSDVEDENEIILHLPISLGDINKNNNIVATKNTNKNVFTINDINSNSSDWASSDSEQYSLEKDDSNIKVLKNKIKELEKINKGLELELHDYKLLYNDDNHGMNDKKVYKMETNFLLIDSETGKQIVTESTNIPCWWCTYNFDTVPCFLPDKYSGGKYYVFGCFCSYNCATAYNLNMSDYKVGDRYSLLKRMYNTTFNNYDDIPIAPERKYLRNMVAN